MPDHYLKVFRDLHIIDLYVNWIVNQFFAFASVKAKNGVGLHAKGFCRFNSFDNILRIAAARKGNQNVVSVCQGTKLTGKDIFVTGVICQAGVDGSICC